MTVERTLKELREIGMQTPSNLMSVEEVQARVHAYLESVKVQRDIPAHTVEPSGVIIDFTVKDVQRGCWVYGNDENGNRLEQVFLRGRRHAKRAGRSMLGRVVLSFTVTPIIPARSIKFESEIPSE